MKLAKIAKTFLLGIAVICLLIFVISLLLRYMTPNVVKPSLKNGNLYIYDDFSSNYNHYRVKGLISSKGRQNLVKNLDENFTEAVYSGESSIRSQIGVQDDSWGGWMFTYGYYGPFATEHNLNWGDHRNCGYNLTGAESLTFSASGETGGERIEFFFGGLGWDLETGRRTKRYADSTPKLTTGVVELTDEFAEYTISLKNVDLSYISSGFGFIVSGNYNKENVVFYIDDIKISFSDQVLAPSKQTFLDFRDLIPVCITAITTIIAALINRDVKHREKASKKKAPVED